MANTNTAKNIAIDLGNLAQHLHVFVENLFLIKSSVHHQVPKLFVHRSAIVGNSVGQVLVAANRINIFENLHCLKVSHFAIAVKGFCKVFIFNDLRGRAGLGFVSL